VRRREFIAGLGAAAALPVAALAQQTDRVRRIGVLLGWDDNTVAKAWFSGFTQGISELGWTDGRDLRMDLRWAAGNVDRMRRFAKELVGLGPDLILASTTPVTAALQRETQTIPIVFAGISDPVGAGFVASLARPGGNITGFINIESTIGGKWLELLTEIEPTIKRVAMMFNPDTAPGGGSYYLPAFEAAARLSKVEPITAPVHSDAEIETVMTSLARDAGGGLVVQSDGFMQVHRTQIILLAARNKIPVISDAVIPAKEGGLLSYGADFRDIFRRSASYVDRILRGETPGGLPVQVPTKFEMTVNLKTAEALGLSVPQSILVRADEVIE
jgi:putative tryptophan/tyrosine transport system substrate-binding protein